MEEHFGKTKVKFLTIYQFHFLKVYTIICETKNKRIAGKHNIIVVIASWQPIKMIIIPR